MGNTNNSSHQLKNPQSNTIYKVLSLQCESKPYTQNYLHQQFLSQFLSNKKGIGRVWNPICPMHMKVSQNWMTCCFISPLMALVSPLYIFDHNQQFQAQCSIMAFDGKKLLPLKIKNAILIKGQHLCLIILEKPFFKVGWIGISYIDNLNQIKQNRLKVINHPQKVFKEDTIHIQKINQIDCIKKSKSSITSELIIKNKDIIGSIIVKTQNEIVSVVGIQINLNQALIFDKKIFNSIRKKAKQFIDLNINQTMQQINETLFQDHSLIKECNLMK